MNEKCIFCDIAQGSSPAEAVFENDNVIAFYDINPKAPTHILVVPKKHISSIIDVTDNDRELLGEMIKVSRDIAENKGLNESGYRLVFNVGEHSGQVVDHIHLHLLGGKILSQMA